MNDMAFKVLHSTYSNYMESNVEWSGQIPGHWKLLPIRSVFRERRQKNVGPITDFILSVTKDRGVIPYDEKGAIGNNKSEDIERYKVVYPGDLVINKMNVIIGSLGLSRYHGALSQVYIVFEPKNKEININYFAHLVSDSSFYKSMIKYCSGIMELRESLNLDEFKKIPLPVPPLPEQTAIASFLDRKTAQIDNAIRIKEKQIELLKERRQILIHKAVTRGLDPNVRMKDSGVEWIGEIPEGWEVAKNRSLFQERKESGHEDLPILSVSIHTAVSSEELSDEDNIRGKIRIEDKSKYKLVEVGDIAFNMMRAWQGGIGAVSCKGMVSPAYIVAKPIREVDSIYLEYQYRTEIFIQQMDRASKGITDFRKRLYWNEFKNLNTVLPPLKVQKEISNFIVLMQNKTEVVLRTKEHEIEKLKEYKATLINGTVTGKVKVS